MRKSNDLKGTTEEDVFNSYIIPTKCSSIEIQYDPLTKKFSFFKLNKNRRIVETQYGTIIIERGLYS